MSRTGKTRAARTLVELVAALAVTAALVAAVLGVTTKLARNEAVSKRAHNAASLEERLEDLLQEDLTHAKGFREVPGGYALRSHAHLEAKTLERKHLPATVTYRVLPKETGGLLVRTQESEFQPVVTELVAVGVKTIRLQGSAKQDASPPRAPNAVPAAVQVTIEFLEADRQPIRWTIRTRAIWE